jgi:RND superfamily putative drug exporter
VAAACLAGALGAYLLLPSISSAPPAGMSYLLPQHPAALRTEAEAVKIFRFPVLTPYVVVQRDPHGLSAAAIADAYGIAARASTRHPAKLDPLVAAAPVTNTLGLFPVAREHGTTVVTYLYFPSSTLPKVAYRDARRYASLFPEADDVVGVSGAIPARIAQYDEIQSHLHLVEGVTIAVILLIVGTSLRAVLAPFVTVATAGLAYVVSQRVLGWLAERTGIVFPRELSAVSIALMLGVVTDYSVFFLTAARRRLAAGESRTRAVRGAAASYGPIVAAAGLLVSLGVATLTLGTLGFFRSFGPGMAITVFTGLVLSLTFVPAVLTLLGRWAFWPGLGGGTRVPTTGRWTARVLTTRVVAVLLAAVVLAALGLATSGLARARLGLALVNALPSGNPVARAGDAAASGFSGGILAPTELVVRTPHIAVRRHALRVLQHELEHEPHVTGVLGPAQQPTAERLGIFFAPSGGAARFVLIFDAEPTGAQAIDALRRIERDMPRFLARARLGGARVQYGGETGLGIEADRATSTSLWRVGLALLGVTFVFLALYLRTIVAPLYLALASGLALAATFGLTTYLFQGLLGADGITYYLPVAIGVLLVSLGADYNLFVVGRISQEAGRRSIRDSVRVAAPRAGRAISIAGIAMALSFALLAIVPLRPFRVFAFAMSAGILIDALLVRSVLVPSMMIALGRFGFWPRDVSPRGRPESRMS